MPEDPDPAPVVADPEPADTGVLGPAAASPEAGTTIDDRTDFEVFALVAAAVDAIADGIASRCLAAVPALRSGRVIVVAADTPARIEAARRLRLTIDLVDEALTQAVASAPRKAAVEGVLVDGLAAATAAVDGLTALIDRFRSQTSYAGRAVEVDEGFLRAALAGALTRRSVTALLPDIPVGDGGHRSALVRRLAAMSARAERLRPRDGDAAKVEGAETEGEAGAPAPGHPAVTAYDALMDDLLGAEGGLETLAAAGPLLDLLDAADPPVFLLRATVRKAGGSYRIRKNLLTMVLGWDGASATGGAIADFVLWNAGTRTVAAAGVLRHLVGNVALPRRTERTAWSNAEACAPSETPGGGDAPRSRYLFRPEQP